MGIKILHLTGITTVPNAKGQNKIDRANGKKTDSDDEVMPKSWYKNMGITPPKNTGDEIELDDFGQVLLDPEDVDEVGIDVSIPLHLYAGAEATTDDTSIVYTSYGFQFSVFESIEEVNDYVYYLHAPWYIKRWTSLKINFENVINYFSRKKKLKTEEIN